MKWTVMWSKRKDDGNIGVASHSIINPQKTVRVYTGSEPWCLFRHHTKDIVEMFFLQIV